MYVLNQLHVINITVIFLFSFAVVGVIVNILMANVDFIVLRRKRLICLTVIKKC